MPTSDARLEAFISAYERANGERLHHADAQDAAMRVLAFVELLSAPSEAWPPEFDERAL